MADNVERKFVVEEVTRANLDSYGNQTQSPVRFEWDKKTYTAPRHGWEYAVRLRTVREDYVGTDQPVEQVLGANFEPFPIHGIWDDRYAGAGFAENQRIEFEKLVQRGNLVRISFESIQITGLITNFKPTYFTSFRIGYEFTFSPHYRVSGGDARANAIKVPTVRDPVQGLTSINGIIAKALERFDSAPGPIIAGTLYKDLKTQVLGWQSKALEINTVVDNRVLVPSGEGVNSISRVVQGFRSLGALAAASLPLTATVSTATGLFYEADAIATLGFDSFTRGLANDARVIVVEAEKNAVDLAKLVTEDAKVIYRPLEGESLYAISNRFFGTPHQWHAIALRNTLHTMTLTGTEVLVIPDARTP